LDEFEYYDWMKIKGIMKKPAFFGWGKLLHRKEQKDLNFVYYAIGE